MTYFLSPYTYEIAMTWNRAMMRRGMFPLYSSNSINIYGPAWLEKHRDSMNDPPHTIPAT